MKYYFNKFMLAGRRRDNDKNTDLWTDHQG